MAKHRTSTKLKRSTVIEPVASSPRELAAWATAPQDCIWRDFHKGCAVCGQGDHEDDPLGPFLDGTKDNQSSWVHQRCWAKWKDRERWQQWWNEHRKAYCRELSNYEDEQKGLAQ